MAEHGRTATPPGVAASCVTTPRFATPTGAPCPRAVRVDGSVDGAGACFGCGTCLLFGGLVEVAPDPA